MQDQPSIKKQIKSCPSTYKTFSLALQALVILAKENTTCTSNDIAESIQSEATLLRRILSVLAGAGILETREGRDGGYKLSRPAETILLGEVYHALQIAETRCQIMLDATGEHLFGTKMKSIIAELTEEMDQSIYNTLQRYTILDLLEQTYELY